MPDSPHRRPDTEPPDGQDATSQAETRPAWSAMVREKVSTDQPSPQPARHDQGDPA